MSYFQAHVWELELLVWLSSNCWISSRNKSIQTQNFLELSRPANYYSWIPKFLPWPSHLRKASSLHKSTTSNKWEIRTRTTFQTTKKGIFDLKCLIEESTILMYKTIHIHFQIKTNSHEWNSMLLALHEWILFNILLLLWYPQKTKHAEDEVTRKEYLNFAD